MSIDDKVSQAARNLFRLENPDRKMTGKRRRRASYWLRLYNRYEHRQQREFARRELWPAILKALDEGKIQSVTIL
jgi:hypothetical protein